MGGATLAINPKKNPTQKPVHIGQLISFPRIIEDSEILFLKSTKIDPAVIITVIPTNTKIIN